jgi:hypothetical protein
MKGGFKSRFPGLLILVLFIAFSGCTKQGKVRWVYYEETRCADKWTFTNNNELLKQNVVDYLATKGVKVYELEIFASSPAETCSACICKTGRLIKCKIAKHDLDEASSEGFHQ